MKFPGEHDELMKDTVLKPRTRAGLPYYNENFTLCSSLVVSCIPATPSSSVG